MAMTATGDRIEIIYDGACPVCAAYFRLQRLRDNGVAARMIDARARPELLDRYAARGIDLNRDFVLRINSIEYVGGDAMFVLARLGSRHTFGRRINALIFRSRLLSALSYPLLRAGRAVLLFCLGRSLIEKSNAQT
jgi:predicted DCC family thiol-disulfide oxidoreductase YuxK